MKGKDFVVWGWCHSRKGIAVTKLACSHVCCVQCPCGKHALCVSPEYNTMLQVVATAAVYSHSHHILEHLPSVANCGLLVCWTHVRVILPGPSHQKLCLHHWTGPTLRKLWPARNDCNENADKALLWGRCAINKGCAEPRASMQNDQLQHFHKILSEARRSYFVSGSASLNSLPVIHRPLFLATNAFSLHCWLTSIRNCHHF